jgi:RND family efflux transporter MFP subunit
MLCEFLSREAAFRGALLSICLIMMPGCEKPAQQQGGHPAPTVSVLNPIERDVVEWDEYTGRLKEVESVEVRARVSGMLERADFLEGTIVNKGDLLFELDRRPFEAAVQQAQGDLESAQAQFALAQVEFKRLDELRASAAVSGTEYEQQREKVAQGRASITGREGALKTAKLNLEFAEVRAPITGRISNKMVNAGNFINGGEGDSTILTTIKSQAPIYCYVDADERSLLKYQRLAKEKKRASAREAKVPAFLQLADETTFEHEGVIDFVDNSLNPNTGTLRARAVFDNKDGVLTPGLFGRLRVPGSGQYKAILIPSEAIGTDQAQKFVYVVGDDNKALARPVTLGTDFDGFRVVLKGLATEDRVIVNGLMKVRPGAEVVPEKVAWPDRPMHIAPNVRGDATTQPATTLPSGASSAGDLPADAPTGTRSPADTEGSGR